MSEVISDSSKALVSSIRDLPKNRILKCKSQQAHSCLAKPYDTIAAVSVAGQVLVRKHSHDLCDVLSLSLSLSIVRCAQ